jgi:tRNA(Ile)-lysidine synthase
VRDRFRRHLLRSRLLAGERTLLVAVSGGLDSVVLLHLLRFGGFDFAIRAAHFDHRMRAGSAADARWVRGLCRAWGVPLIEGTAVTPPRGEADAREQRYAFLARAADAADEDDVRADAILTAHHADDQAETLLFRIARGTGIAGLRGIPARRGRIVRPLLPFSRAELAAYAGSAGLQWREDPTNRELRYARNRIRLVVLPALEAASPGAGANIARLAGRAAELEDAWRALLERAVADVLISRSGRGFALARDRLLGYHPHVRARVLRLLLHDLGCIPGRAATRAAVRFIRTGSSGAAIALPHGVRMAREFDRILLERAAGPAAAEDAPLMIADSAPGQAVFRLGGKDWTVRWSMAALDQAPGAHAGFDPSALRFPLALRGWRPGDRIRLPFGTRKLKELFRERRIGRSARGRIPVLVDADGAVVWVVGVAQATTAAPRERQVFSITVLDGNST